MLAIEEVIRKLGYDRSEHLYFMHDISSCPELSPHDRKILQELKPYAFYTIERRILAVFFNDLSYRDEQNVRIKIWNAQYPIIISDEGDVVVIYSGTILGDRHDPLVQLQSNIEKDFDGNNPYSYWNLQESIRYGLPIKGGKNLNETLLENLDYIIKKLTNEYEATLASRLVLQILFIRYLIDRGVDFGYSGISGEIESTRSDFLELVKDKDRLIDLISHLKNRFNGNLFETKDWDEITTDSLDMLYRFLSGTEKMSSGQLLLFPFYDFNIIPVELISCIYEILLGPYKQSADMAYYTPEGLADYIVDRIVGKRLSVKQECSVFDPSCGSGIFLVKSLQRILEKNADANGFIQNNSSIIEIVKNNIFGLDYNEQSVDVTIFSLYITLLDYKNPKNLDDFKLPLLKDRNIFVGDFFDKNIPKSLQNHNFDAILGNPPWGKVEQNQYISYCKEKRWPLPDKDISAAFLQKVIEIGSENTECGLVMPSKMLYKKRKLSLQLRLRWLKSVQVQWILELSAVRRVLFPNAIAPAAVISFICKERCSGHKLEFASIKPNMYLNDFGIILMEPDDTKYVPQEMLESHDGLWKVLVYGSYWDYELLEKMKTLPTIGDAIRKAGLERGMGLQTCNGKMDAKELQGRKILKSKKAIGHFHLNNIFEEFHKPTIHRVRNPKLFEAPYVLVPKGIDSTNFTFKAAYVNESFLYTDAICGFKGTPENKDILLNLCGLLNSSFYSYLNLMKSSSVGIEREQFFLDELLNYPYLYSDKLADIVRQGIEGYLCPNDLCKKVDECVLEMYGVTNNPFVNFALNIRIPEICNKYHPRKCTNDDMLLYGNTFQSVWDRHFAGSGVCCSTIIYPDIKGRFAAYSINLTLSEKPSEVKIMPEVGDDIALLKRFCISQLNESFFQIKNVIRLTDDSIVIVKLNDAKYWHPAMAIKDSHKVINDILLGKDNNNEVKI